MRSRCAVGLTPWPKRRWFRFSTTPGSRSDIGMGASIRAEIAAEQRETPQTQRFCGAARDARPQQNLPMRTSERTPGVTLIELLFGMAIVAMLAGHGGTRGSAPACGRPRSVPPPSSCWPACSRRAAIPSWNRGPACSARATRRAIACAAARARLRTGAASLEMAGASPAAGRPTCPAGRRGGCAPPVRRCGSGRTRWARAPAP